MSNELKLEDLIPELSSFNMSKLNKEYKLRLVTMADHVWFQKEFGGLEKFFLCIESRDWEKLIKTAFHLLVDKSDFLARTETVIDDNGENKQVRVTGPEVLLRSLSGLEEMNLVIRAINESIINSSPVMREATKRELKKNETVTEPTGEQSLISSPASTATLEIPSQ